MGRCCQITESYSAVSVHCTHKRSSAERWADSAVLIPHRPSPLTSYPDNATIHKRRRTQDLEFALLELVPELLLSTAEVLPQPRWVEQRQKEKTEHVTGLQRMLMI